MQGSQTLLLPDPSNPFRVKIGASDYAIRPFVLYQDDKPITFENCKLDPTQCRHIVQEKELFVVIHALKS